MNSSFFNLANYFYKVCEKNKKHISIKYKDKEINYDQLNKLSNQVANYFLSKGIKSYDVVGIFNTRNFRICKHVGMYKNEQFILI